MTETIEQQLAAAADQLDKIAEQMAQAESGRAIQQLNKKYGALAPVVERWRQFCAARQRLTEARELESDPEMAELAAEEQQIAGELMMQAEELLLEQLAPRDENDSKNAFIEIRAAVGGDESCLFAGDLLRMYNRWAESNNIKLNQVSASEGEVGGYKEVIAKASGRNACALFKHEAGAHRVQRVPETESQGRIHTSVCTVAVLPESDFKDAGIENADLRFDTFRASGAGGQHVNTTDSAVRITHLPTGIVAECQDDRSQHRNRDKALEIIAARVREHKLRAQRASEDASRREMVKSGERADKIRTYNFPQGRVTDHRVGLTIRRISEILAGDLGEFHTALARAERAEQLERAALERS
ncbi:MAG: peptide chain release factor 1 [Betaproteobacteria bacterium]|nr:peptide chain release factor 1 [Betaproteobacteria bacterium]